MATPLLTDEEKSLRSLVRQLNGYAYSQGEADSGESWTRQDKYGRLTQEAEDKLIAAIDTLRAERDAALKEVLFQREAYKDLRLNVVEPNQVAWGKCIEERDAAMAALRQARVDFGYLNTGKGRHITFDQALAGLDTQLAAISGGDLAGGAV